MKKKYLLFVGLVIIMSSCQIDRNNSSAIICNVEKIMASDFPIKKGFDPIIKRRYHSYNIYVSLLIINNTTDTISIPVNDNILNSKGLIDRSLFIGYIKDTRINFSRVDNNNKIQPKDSIHVWLYSSHFTPTVNDSLFICQLKNIRLEYECDKKTNRTKKHLKKIVINNTKQNIYYGLGNNISPEVAFDLKKMDSNGINKFCGH